MPEWQSIESAPKDGTRILLKDKFERNEGCDICVGIFGSSPKGEAWVSIPGNFRKRPTHWMPMPSEGDANAV